jgi:transcriptional regulator with XRE-family HTH domain
MYRLTLAKRLYQLRRERGLTQEAVANGMLCNRRSVAAWERGEKVPALDFFCAVAQFFNVSTDYLLGLTDNPTPHPITENECANDAI